MIGGKISLSIIHISVIFQNANEIFIDSISVIIGQKSVFLSF